MKKFGIKLGVCALALMMAMSFTSCDTGGSGLPGAIFTPGVFTGTGRGYMVYDEPDATGYRARRSYTVWVQVDAHGIVDVWHNSTAAAGAATPGAHHTNNMGLLAINIMRDRILRHQTTGVDTISGNTVSSEGFLEGVVEALQKAEAPRRFFQPTQQSRRVGPVNVDILVVGSGFAGSSAALAAILENPDANVMLIEKQGVPGGVSAHTGNVVTFSRYNTEADIEALGDYFMNIAQNFADRSMIDTWLNTAWQAFTHLFGTIPAGLSFSGSQDVERMRNFPNVTNPRHAAGFFTRARNAGVLVWLGVEATELLTNAQGHVIGVRAECSYTGHTWNFNTRAGVILATGGFGSCPALRAEFNRDTKFDPDYGVTGLGTGIHMGRAIGADTVFRGGVGGFSIPGPGFPGLIAGFASFRSNDWGLISETGRSFFYEFGGEADVNAGPFTQQRSYGPGEYNYAGHMTPENFVSYIVHERSRGDYMFQHRWMVDVRWQDARENDIYFLNQPSYDPEFSFWILSRPTMNAGTAAAPNIVPAPIDAGAAARGHMFQAASIPALAALIGMDAELLAEAWAKTNVTYGDTVAVITGTGAAQITHNVTGVQFRALRNQPASLISFGGLKLNEYAQVVAADNELSPIPAGQPIPGLWATGDTANGQILYLMYPGSGTALSFGGTFGYIAAMDALARLAYLDN